MPFSAVTGRAPIVGSHVSFVSRAMPPGLAKPVAVFAWSFVWPIPTAHESSVRSSTCRRIVAARASGSSTRTPMNASSQPSTSTGTSKERSTSITSADAAS